MPSHCPGKGWHSRLNGATRDSCTHRRSVEALETAICDLESLRFDSVEVRERSNTLSEGVFRSAFNIVLTRAIAST